MHALLRAPSLRYLLAAVAAGAASSASVARAQQASIDPAHAPADDPHASAPDEGEGFRFDGRGIYAGAGPGMLPEVGEAGIATRLQLVFPVAVSWFAIEAGLLGHSMTVTDHHGDPIDINMGAITTGARFALPGDAPVRPYAAARFAHLHFFPDPYGEHGHGAAGDADHASHHRWGAGGALGLELGVPERTSRFRLAIEAEAFALTGPKISAMGQVVALLGIGF
jgi:hypothetical protein